MAGLLNSNQIFLIDLKKYLEIPKSTEWILILHPNGSSEDFKSNVGLYLHCKNANETAFDFTAKYKLGVQKHNGKDCSIKNTELVQSKEQLVKCSGLGLHKFITHDELFNEENGYVVGGKLVVFVELTIEVEIVKPPPRIARTSDFKKMFENEAFIDFHLKTKFGEVLKAHKVVLAARSPVFYKMLTNEMEETKTGLADVPDFDSKIMKEILRFIYCDEVEGLSEIASELVYAAEKYLLDELKEICLQEMASSLQVGNVIKLLNIAYELSDAEDLFDMCLDLIANNYCKVNKECPSGKDIPKELMSEIISRLCQQRHTLKI